MAVKSMTGFGRSAGQDGDAAWSWEIRTVNNRSLDIRLRLPQGFENLEAQVKDTLTKRVKRGSCTVNLTLKGAPVTADLRLNESVLLKLSDLAEHGRQITGRHEQVPLAALLNMKGVIEIAESVPADESASPLNALLLKSFDEALNELCQARLSEGERLYTILSEKLQDIETLTRNAEASPARAPEAIQERLSLQLKRLVSDSVALDENRLHQEAVLIATKADIEEEIQRLHAHTSAARDLLKEDAPIGRRLEFLSQEFQREANTLCSKSNAIEITRLGLQLKATIDQFREQVQNVE